MHVDTPYHQPWVAKEEGQHNTYTAVGERIRVNTPIPPEGPKGALQEILHSGGRYMAEWLLSDCLPLPHLAW